MSSDSAQRRFPDFIIAGAMKCGTTSLHFVLDAHPQVFIPKPEIFFFDLDDWIEHPDFCYYQNGRWVQRVYDPQSPELLDWYARFFADARPDQLVGEDSTTYLPSPAAPKRIAEFLPQAKVILLLRDPASRAYSHYWHLVRTGRCGVSFERALQQSPHGMLNRGCYKPQLEHMKRWIPEDRLLVLSFEDYTANMQPVINRVTTFLGLSEKIDVASVKSHRNPGTMPRSLPLHLLCNRVVGPLNHHEYSQHLQTEGASPPKPPLSYYAKRGLKKLHRVVNRSKPGKPPAMKAETRQMLDRMYQRVNAGLADLAGEPLDASWYKSQGEALG